MENYTVDIQDTGIEYELFESLRKDNLSYVYRGALTPKITDYILNLAEIGFIQNNDSKSVKRKIYHVMVEGLQNIIKHQPDFYQEKYADNSIFILRRESNEYLFTTCNLIENDSVENLRNHIEHINKLEKDELKEYYKTILAHGTISSKGGAGLGLIDMCLKSGNKLSYSFEKLDANYSYFYFHATVSSSKEPDNPSIKNEHKWFGVKSLHKKIATANILIIFNSYFSQEGMINLLSIIEKQMTGKLNLTKRMYSIMVEMIQNIIKHSDEYESTEDGKAGLFYISEHKEMYTLHSGNYIAKDKIAKLQQNVIKVNSLNEADLEKEYEKQLLDNEFVTNQETGLGLIDMKIKAKNNIELDIFNVNSKLSFCVIRTRLQK